MNMFSKLDFRLPGLLCLSLIGFNFTVKAELPPFVYDEMKRNASDVVVVRILEVAKAKAVVRGKRQQITYEAKVLRVIRTKSRLQSDGAIVIQSHYYMFGPGEVGPSNPRRLKKNDVVHAYLSKGQKADEFQIAAAGHSFEQPKPQREGEGVIDEPAPPPAIRVEPVRPRPDFPAPDPKLGQFHRQPAVRPRPDFPPPDPGDEPAIGGGPVMPGGGAMPIPMPMMPDMPGRFEIIPTKVQQNGRPVAVVLKLDTQTGEVWQLKMKTSQFFHNGQPQVRSSLSFEPIFEGQPPHPDRGRVAPAGRPLAGEEKPSPTI